MDFFLAQLSFSPSILLPLSLVVRRGPYAAVAKDESAHTAAQFGGCLSPLPPPSNVGIFSTLLLKALSPSCVPVFGCSERVSSV